MKFREYINEKTLNRKLSELISMCAVPLSTPMMDRLGYSYESEAYHMTNAQFLPNMKKLQGSKKQISCFTKGGPELMRLPSNPNILVKLEGNIVIGGNSDIWTLPDAQGRRWLDIQVSDKEGIKIRKFLQGFAERIIIDLGYDIGNSSLQQSELRYVIEEMKPKDRSALYKKYIDKVESWIDGGGYKNLNNYLKNLDQFVYNEVIINQFKINGVYSVEGNDKESEVKAQGLKYLGVIAKTKIAKIDV